MTDERDRKKYQQKYYRDNREKLKEARRQRYKEDDAVRDAANARATRHYWFKVRPALIQEAQDIDTIGLDDVQPVGTLGITVQDKRDARYGSEVKMPVYVTEAVATIVGRTPTTVRVWERRGILPAPTFRARDIDVSLSPGANPRLYTQDELKVLITHRHLLTLPSKKMAQSEFSKQVHAAMAEMQLGLIRVPK